ncbi:Kunitz family trypsin and protease inhibitor protein [Raphanus sativus]|uniref:Kunitz trypsin inhibitor 2-like n=1 Tax=Raphanus sativus TaxID=3726 RepID=A0A9W3CFF4_RAPSA|nr:kunitz trypsin inhibitor 2-like [Raphanus sativus]KAJ4874954.1 Kunitz family trypsin and protease inhibitor protein [Raphanus sativus]
MKSSFLVTFLLAAAVCSHGLEEVKDSNGNPVRVGAQYFIQPVKSNGGGLVPASTVIDRLCPLGISQTLLPYQTGVPVSFGYHPNILGRYTIDTSSAGSEILRVQCETKNIWTLNDS